MVLKPLRLIVDVLPILGEIVALEMGLVAGLIAFICALVTIAVAWIFYRPILGVTLLVIAGGGIGFLIWKHKAAKPTP